MNEEWINKLIEGLYRAEISKSNTILAYGMAAGLCLFLVAFQTRLYDIMENKINNYMERRKRNQLTSI